MGSCSFAVKWKPRIGDGSLIAEADEQRQDSAGANKRVRAMLVSRLALHQKPPVETYGESPHSTLRLDPIVRLSQIRHF